MFGLKPDNDDKFYLDDVSVVNLNAVGTELLLNPSFEDSSSTITDWSVWCQSGCTSEPARIVTNANCYLNTGNCVESRCANTNIETLAQSISAIPGDKYTISFRLRQNITGGSGANKFYLDIR